MVLLQPKGNQQNHILNGSRKPFTAVAFSHDGKHLATGEVRGGGVCCAPPTDTHVVVYVSERPQALCAGVGGGGLSGGRGPVPQARRLLRGVLLQRRLHRLRGIPARHDRQRVGLEGEPNATHAHTPSGVDGASKTTRAHEHQTCTVMDAPS